MRRALALSLALLGGCSWTLDGNAPELPLHGAPPELDTLHRYNNGPVSSSAIVYGTDGAYWLSLQEETSKLRVVPLSGDAGKETTLEGDKFLVTYRVFFVWKKGEEPAESDLPRPATLELSSAGQTDPPTRFDFPVGIGSIVIGGYDDVFAYSAVPAYAPTTFELIHKDGSFRRTVPLPDDTVDADNLAGTFFSGDAQFFFDRGPCTSGCMTDADDADLDGTERRSLVAHSTTSETDIDLGQQPRRIVLYEPSAKQRQFITCSDAGLATVPIVANAGIAARVLDPSPCVSEDFDLLRITEDGVEKVVLFYTIGDELRRVPVDGSAAPVRALDYDAVRVLSIYDEDNIVYSRDPDTKFIYGVGDGWLGSWRFMNRGRVAGLSRDRTKMRWLENAAQSGGIGDLDSAPIGGDPTRLARNVYQYDELSDGRVLAASNHAFRGTQNRIIVIDEAAGEARWVVDQAARYSFIPKSSDLLVEIVTGPSSSDLVRVPIPPAQPDMQ